MDKDQLKRILEAVLMASSQPLNEAALLKVFDESQELESDELNVALQELMDECEGRSFELHKVGSGYRFQVRKDYADYVTKLWEEKPARYSRALLETLSLIAYRQPITRGEIEAVRGVSVSSHIIKTLDERGWIKIVGHRDVPGKPSLYATTKEFLDYFSLASLNDLPSLQEIRDIDEINAELDLRMPNEGPQEEASTGDEAGVIDLDVANEDEVEDVATVDATVADETDVDAAAAVLEADNGEQRDEADVGDIHNDEAIVDLDVANEDDVDGTDASRAIAEEDDNSPSFKAAASVEN